MRTVKAARFNAAERFERKNTLSLFALSMVSLYFVGLSVWQAVYAPALDEAANRLITLVSIMSSVFTLVLALIESMNDYKMKAHHMHACALAVNDLYHEFKLMQAPDAGLMQEFRRRYNDVVRSCPYNHARIDYLMARAERGLPWEEKAWVHLRYVPRRLRPLRHLPRRPAAGAGPVPLSQSPARPVYASASGPLPAVPMMRSISNTRSLRAFCTELMSFLRWSHRRRCASCSLLSSSSMRPACVSTWSSSCLQCSEVMKA